MFVRLEAPRKPAAWLDRVMPSRTTKANPHHRTGASVLRCAGVARRQRRTITTAMATRIAIEMTDWMSKSRWATSGLSATRARLSGHRRHESSIVRGSANRTPGPIRTTPYVAPISTRSSRPWRRPSGYARSAWNATANTTLPRIRPTVNTNAAFDSFRALRKNANPAAVSSAPKRFAGRLHQANSPVPMNDHPTQSPSAPFRPERGSWSVASTSATAIPPQARPANPIATSARRRPITRGRPRAPRRTARPWR